ncbi:MAG: DegT/DnrJ/EryC1/StrS family aminotransferase [Lachnospiraceae bacterium]|nr:DegT/DnrJ/EryC1/StrS family aminotransferase [Lachnospiraceae bacterium]MBD5503525.1 DegT/DnrJ/EryC1/StrS family aminotransferase [Lachnospiraceae bacterium]
MDKILVTRASMPPMQEYMDEIADIWETHWLTNMGAEHEKLTVQLKEYLKVDYISLFANGHMALELGLQALNLSGGEVITTPFTFASTTHAIVRNKLKPVFCDIREDDYTIDASKIESLVTDRTVAIVPVHVYGNICQIEEIDRIAKKYGLKVVYDAAHAFGETYQGKGVGSFGDVSMFSFHATKVYNTIEGGGICYKDEDYGKKLFRLKNFGIRDEESVDGVGANAKMNEFSAAMGICNLRHVDDEIAQRRKVVERYRKNLSGIDGLRLNVEQPDVVSNYAYFPVFFDEQRFGATRNEVSECLKRKNIFPRKYFYPLTNTFECYNGQFDVSNTPVALRVSKRMLTLPLYAGLDLDTVDQICEIIAQAGKEAVD